MTELIISFDTEDYVNPHAADGILRASKIVREAGFMPCHNVVARTAEALVKWGRQDVIDELKQCEIETHTMRHSHHPTINEYTDLADFDEAMRIFRKEEDAALSVLRDILGDCTFAAACPPGMSTSYVATYGYADMGIPIYDGSLVYDEAVGRPLRYCNMINLGYHHPLDYFGVWEKSDVLDMIEKMAELEICIVYHHPALNAAAEFYDEQNFKGENRPESDWIMSTPVPPEQVKKFEENLRFFLETVKNDPRFHPTTYSELAKKLECRRVVKPAQLPEIRALLSEDFFPVTMPESFSLSDIMLACRDFLMGKDEHICGKVYGFLDTPYAIREPVTLRANDIRAAAEQIADGTFLPTAITVDGQKIGPADWMRAALAVLCGEETVTVAPGPWQIDLDEFPRLKKINYRGSWIHMKSFEDRYLSSRARLQSWTISLPKDTKRRIY